MADAKAAGAPPDKKPQDAGFREVRILMLHGYTQSGPLFRAKTRALEKLLTKSLAPLKTKPTLIYPTAPNKLSARDIPGYSPAATTADTAGETDAWAWFRKDEAAGTYRLLHEGMTHLARAIREDARGAVDGVVGFSQGGAVAGVLASALEGAREGEAEWAGVLREANGGRPLRFAVVYSGFFAVPEDLRWVYEPRVRTPTLHFIGSLDTVVDEGRGRGLVARCEDPVVVVHPGGHYVPVSKEWVTPLVGFVRRWCEDDADES